MNRKRKRTRRPSTQADETKAPTLDSNDEQEDANSTAPSRPQTPSASAVAATQTDEERLGKSLLFSFYVLD
ncbi:hypothetical protein MJO28_015935 [Puccinia striiformis f. sp. tritici]|uniref:Uncharacterized protein n=1 Tax=Puccinia striiformis f. sp. tritici TaxID=168172 RepID=A0ACC0DQE8_9BASI|nr:hypothetical protein MJO28_015935 [Puccinia striiformis f. sp. tritici]